MTTLVDAADSPVPDEDSRLVAVRRYGVLYAPAEPAFERIAATATRLLGTPAAAVGFFDSGCVRIKAAHGLDGVPGGYQAASMRRAVADHAGRWTAGGEGPLLTGAPAFRFAAGVPLVTPDGHRIGVLCVLDSEPLAVSPAQFEHLEDLAALVVDGLELRLAARLTVEREEGLRHQAEELAEALQASLLPPRPPDIPQMELASRYLAGVSGLQVGGDFFDVFRLGHNDWGIVLGDVCGKGARPASVAMLARWAVRAASVHQFSPARVLQDVNSVFAGDPGGDDRYCSAVFARLELDTCGAWLTVANAGHPRPVLVRASGKVEVRSEATIPIGLFDHIEPYDDRVGLGPGDALVFYTDGITEARSGDELFGEDRLVAVLSGLTGAPAGVIADRVIDAATEWTSGRVDDDVAILVVRVPDDAGQDPLGRVSAATGVPADRLELPGYPKDRGLRR